PPIDLTWDLVGRSPPSPAAYPEMPGVNVISPTWFHLAEGGLVTSRADARYVAEAHARGWAVWPLFGNDFDPDRTHEVLAKSESRLDLVRQLLAQAKLYGFDGVNVDWENMRPEDRDLFSQFVRELVPLAHAAGLVVSVDVTFPGPSAFWQKPYDRKALGRAADFLVVMGYDQYTEGSSEAGPVSGFPWVEAGVAATVAEVPAWKVVLGVPFYSRVWTEGSEGWTSRAVGMAAARAYLERPDAQVTVDDRHGLPLVRWQEGGRTYRMWAETADTLRRRAALAREAGLAGVASWQRALADGDSWQALAQGLGGR
ncbi:MAG: glycosyl hydrolase, partial [Clostridia bacterium]|nr:glycosyl hydrolase [Clostridia bacterium]